MWPTKELGSVATIERAGIYPQDIPPDAFYVGLENIERGGKLVNVATAGEAGLGSTKFRFTNEHVLFGKLRPYLAKVSRPNFSGVCSTDILPIRPGPELDRDYLAYFLLFPATIALATSKAVGINLPRLNPGELAGFQIPFPPLDQQRDIAHRLNQGSELIRKRHQAIELLGSLAHSAFREMFGELVSNDRGWPSATVRDFVQGFQSGKNFAPAEEETSLRVLKVSAVTSGIFKPEESKPVPLSYSPPKSHFVRDGDLLFSRANTSELIGATALVVSPPPNLLLPDKLWRFVWHSPAKALPTFVHFLFQQPEFRQKISQAATGTSGSMKNISQSKVLAINCGLPPLDLQTEFARKVESIASLWESAADSLAELDALFLALQYQAFDGSL
jgi:type I restriction enzyme S subunit